MFTHLLALIIGFVAGALVFRNNASKAEALVQKAQEEATKAKALLKK
jgi:uncharacterized membrane-anchored protein YhcB (DUF1043 family)